MPSSITSDSGASTASATPRILSVAITLSNLLLVSMAALSALFCAYSIAKNKSDLLVRLSPAVIGLAAPLLLLFRPAVRLTAAASLFGVAIGLYTAQILSTFLEDPERPALQAIEKVAKDAGVRFDPNTQLEEIDDFRNHGTAAYPSFYPYHLLDRPLLIDGQPVVPLGSIANILTVCCNEGGRYLTFKTDEHGFPNPANAWTDPTPPDMAFVGASSAVGEAVPPADNLLSQLQARYPHIVTVGAGGNGPFLELASIREYLHVLRPKRVLWMFSESHTPEYLEGERDSKLMRRYLDDPSFSQGLLQKQAEIDGAIKQYFDNGLQQEAVAESWKTKVKSFFVLKNVRFALYYFVTNRKAPTKPELDIPLYEQVLTEGKKEVGEWGGQITLVYFPDSSRYPGICNYSPALRKIYDRTHAAVLKAAQDEGLPIIDLAMAFPDVPVSQSAENMLYFYPYPAHYTPQGYHRAGKFIMDALKEQER